ncbi:hypothetical protein RO3G_08805 [Rhizopus delemar RA 99-880]|uniref:Uncharacterized protein n=1 Tax=Rhizopus delemar (strain RA 99-880 / ATCC MYA-4621 / FGSC 9543 / NRRL 43880) TaxID=246409 RepID=I1C6M0_RHIO9|nr:hypothetical protein RO3G_08805 [Rhizopus delemar RA 99-880]|eukprot:EIE84100.1 hypothetical protein RO3G_08805 [Rhizopus delemar RA 99-880]
MVVVILFGLCPWLRHFGEWVLGWTMGNYKIQVIFVMLIGYNNEEDNVLTSDDEYENRNEQDATNLQPFDNKIR